MYKPMFKNPHLEAAYQAGFVAVATNNFEERHETTAEHAAYMAGVQYAQAKQMEAAFDCVTCEDPTCQLRLVLH